MIGGKSGVLATFVIRTERIKKRLLQKSNGCNRFLILDRFSHE
jgi:hypothetical protein